MSYYEPYPEYSGNGDRLMPNYGYDLNGDRYVGHYDDFGHLQGDAISYTGNGDPVYVSQSEGGYSIARSINPSGPLARGQGFDPRNPYARPAFTDDEIKTIMDRAEESDSIRGWHKLRKKLFSLTGCVDPVEISTAAGLMECLQLEDGSTVYFSVDYED